MEDNEGFVFFCVIQTNKYKDLFSISDNVVEEDQTWESESNECMANDEFTDMHSSKTVLKLIASWVGLNAIATHSKLEWVSELESS